jgi:hypothetical protein
MEVSGRIERFPITFCTGFLELSWSNHIENFAIFCTEFMEDSRRTLSHLLYMIYGGFKEVFKQNKFYNGAGSVELKFQRTVTESVPL